ncbi:hypothetical protein [Duncaniella muris]|uniref:hypothetical protein n=1 Tax=Duncaniella muris TaxID=2094150 RepID=UPI003F662B15
MQALAVSPISIHAYILSKVISIGLISLLSGVLIALFSGMEHSYIHLAVGIMLGSALFTLVGISLSAFISTMNNAPQAGKSVQEVPSGPAVPPVAPP